MKRIAILLALAACGGGGARPAAPVEVTVHGELRALMHGGDGAGVVALADVARPGTIAVGALAQLDGEVTILDGAVHTAVVDGDELDAAAGAGDRQAALLVVAQVPAWREVALDAAIAADGLDAGLEAALRGAGVDLSRAVPLVIEGDFPALDWHVVAGPHTHGAPSGLQRSTPGAAVIVGFYSSAHEGVFTHMGQRTHLHAIVGDLTGHVDALAIAPGARLRIPR